MKTFEKKEEFALGLSFYVDQCPDDPYIKENLEECWMGAEVYFWVNGKNLFEYIDCEPNSTYAYTTLDPLVDFFCDFLIYHISDDPFPISTKSTTAYDMIEETLLIKSDEHWVDEVVDMDWDKVDMDIENKKDMWIYHHGFLPNRGGTFLPDTYMRKVENTIEISWNNTYPYENEEREILFRYKEGVEYVDLKLYKNSVIQFCLEYINHVGEKFPELADKYHEKLKKTIGIQ